MNYVRCTVGHCTTKGQETRIAYVVSRVLPQKHKKVKNDRIKGGVLNGGSSSRHLGVFGNKIHV